MRHINLIRSIAILFLVLMLPAAAFAAVTPGWTSQSTGTTDVTELNDVFFLNDGFAGYTVGSNTSLFKTLDLGAHWVKKDLGAFGATQALVAVQFLDHFTGYIAGNSAGFASGYLLKSTNGGDNWSGLPAIPAGATNKGINDMMFIDSNTGWICGTGDAVVSKTIDAGQTFSAAASGIANVVPYYGIYFIDANTGWVVGRGGRIYKTTSGGSSWTAQTSGVSDTLYKVYFADANNGWVIGPTHYVLLTTDGGSHWTQITSGLPSDVAFNDIKFADDKMTGWIAAGAGKIYKSTDGGYNWSSDTNPTNSTTHLNGIFALSPIDAWAVGTDAGGLNPGTIIKYTDNPTIGYISSQNVGAGSTKTITVMSSRAGDYKDSTLSINTAGTTGITYTATLIDKSTWQIVITVARNVTPPPTFTIPVTIIGAGGGTNTFNININPAPTITKVYRTYTKHGVVSQVNFDRLGATDRTITLEGTKFQPGATIGWKIEPPLTGTGITVSGTTFASSTMYTCKINVGKDKTATGPLGTWEVTITNPDSGFATAEFSILTDSMGPIISPINIQDAIASTTPQGLPNWNPYISGGIEDVTHEVWGPAINMKLLISASGDPNKFDYFQTYPSTVFTQTSSTDGIFKFTLGKIINATGTADARDAYAYLGTTPWQPILYAEDAEGNPSWIPYSSLVAFTKTVGDLSSTFLVYPNPVKPDSPVTFQIVADQPSQNNKIVIYSMDGVMDNSIGGINLVTGRNKVSYDCQTFNHDTISGGIHLAILYNSSGQPNKTKCKLMVNP